MHAGNLCNIVQCKIVQMTQFEKLGEHLDILSKVNKQLL